jgi:hypothetical protein
MASPSSAKSQVMRPIFAAVSSTQMAAKQDYPATELVVPSPISITTVVGVNQNSASVRVLD